MEILTLAIILIVMIISSVIIWLNLPGNFLMLLFMFIWSWLNEFDLVSITELLIILAIMMGLEILEFILSGFAARLSGAGNRSAMLAIVGGILGTIVLGSLFFVTGAIIGLFAGSYLGAYWGEIQAGNDKIKARKVALAALLGNVAAKFTKSAVTLIIGIWMIREVV